MKLMRLQRNQNGTLKNFYTTRHINIFVTVIRDDGFSVSLLDTLKPIIYILFGLDLLLSMHPSILGRLLFRHVGSFLLHLSCCGLLEWVC